MAEPLNPIRPGTQAELNEHLSATIGDEVFKAMDAVGWEHTTNTPQAPVEANPTPAQSPAPESQGTSANPVPQSQAVSPDAINWDEYKDNAGRILGKYNSPNDALKGMHSLLHMAKEALQAKEQANIELGQLRQRLETPQQQAPFAQAPTEVNELESIRTKLQSGEGLDSDDALKLIDGLTKYTEKTVQKAVSADREARTANEEQWKQADEYMRQHYPRSLDFIDEMNVFKSTSPEVGRVFDRLLATAQDSQARTDAAAYLWREYSIANPHVLATPVDPAVQNRENQLNVQAQVRKEEVDAARTQAGLMGNSAGGVHETAQSGTTQQDIDAAAQYMKQTSDGRLWRALTIGKELSGPLFDN